MPTTDWIVVAVGLGAVALIVAVIALSRTYDIDAQLKIDSLIGGNSPTCSFCGGRQSKVETLISGPPGRYICGECVDLCNEIISEKRGIAADQV